MSQSLQSVKQAITGFISASQSSTKTLNEGKGAGSISVNKSIFDIESFLIELRQQQNVNNRLDTSIVSENILKHFNSVSASTAFRPVDYQLNFLHHLAGSFSIDKELYSLIDSFITKYKEQLTLADIVMTRTGVTRCKTNLRFSLNGLRKLALALNRDENNDRTWSPAIMGLVALLNIRFNLEELGTLHDFKHADSLLTVHQEQRLSLAHDYDPTLINSIKMFNNESHFYTFFNQLQSKVTGDEKKFLEKIIMDYVAFVEVGLVVTSTGIKMTKTFEERSKAFQKKLFSVDHANRELHQNYLDILKSSFKELLRGCWCSA